MINSINITNLEKKELPPLDFTFNACLQGSIAFLISAGGAGKSMLALQLAFSISDRNKNYILEPFTNKKLPTGKVLYLNLEDPEKILNWRIKFILDFFKANGIKVDVDENLFIYPLFGFSYQITNQKKINIKTVDHLKKIATDKRLVIIDTFRRFHDLDENDNGAMSELLIVIENICRETETSFLILHHINKTSAKEKSNEQTAIRGASAIVDNARLVINLNNLTDKQKKELKLKEDDKIFINCRFSKINYSKFVDDTIFKKHSGGILEIYKKTGAKESDY